MGTIITFDVIKIGKFIPDMPQIINELKNNNLQTTLIFIKSKIFFRFEETTAIKIFPKINYKIRGIELKVSAATASNSL